MILEDTKARVDLYLEEKVLNINSLVQLDRPILLFLGDEVFDVIKFVNKKNIDYYYFVKLESLSVLEQVVNHWDLIKSSSDIRAVFVHDDYLPQMQHTKFRSLQELSMFKIIPFLVFGEMENPASKSICQDIGACDYISGETVFPLVISKLRFARRLKHFGVSKKDAELNTNKKYKMYFLKRAFDIAVSLTILLLALPLMLIVAIIIKVESPGPIFYVSKRAGRFYKVFDFYKFRSMQQNADAQLAKLKETSNQYQDGGQFVKIANDPRITRFGEFIRNTSIDELPQLINVLKGDMSIVGNRPLPLYEAETLVTDHDAERFLGPAGITGLWQTLKRGKSEMSTEERIMLDRIYARRNSIWFDIKLVFMTVPALFQSEKV